MAFKTIAHGISGGIQNSVAGHSFGAGIQSAAFGGDFGSGFLAGSVGHGFGEWGSRFTSWRKVARMEIDMINEYAYLSSRFNSVIAMWGLGMMLYPELMTHKLARRGCFNLIVSAIIRLFGVGITLYSLKGILATGYSPIYSISSLCILFVVGLYFRKHVLEYFEIGK